MLRTYLLTEACFHVSYLTKLLRGQTLSALVRDKNQISREELDAVHAALHGKKELTQAELEQLQAAYKSKLSNAELALIKMYGVPDTHPLSLPDTTICVNFNAPELLNKIELESFKRPLAAGIFLDCILKPRWLEIFEHRIVNAHSAILPRARGMHAIEQVAAEGDPVKFANAAGASIHYIDEKVDMGALIKTQFLRNLWEHEDIWQIKANSYLTAFELLANYLSQPNAFNRKDGHPYAEAIGPEYKLKEFTLEKSNLAVEQYKQMQMMENQAENFSGLSMSRN